MGIDPMNNTKPVKLFSKMEFLVLTGITLAVLLLWRTTVVFPLKILVVFFHELSHGLMALLTGGEVLSINLTMDEGGLCTTRGGIRWVILSAGYLGSLLWGGFILLTSAFSHKDKLLCALLGALLFVLSILWLRPLISLGFLFVMLASCALVVGAYYMTNRSCGIVLKVIGIATILYVPQDIISDAIWRSTMPSDARMLGQLTGIPTVVWGGIWFLLSTIVGGFLFYSSILLEHKHTKMTKRQSKQ